MRKYLLVLLNIVFVSAVLILSGCKKDSDSSSGPSNNNNNEAKVTVSVTGTVVDENNNPISGATVNAYGTTTTTSNLGVYSFKDISVTKDRFFIKVSKSGYFDQSRAEKTGSDSTITLNFKLMSSAATHTVSANDGGVAELENGSKVKLSANSVVKEDGSAYTGTVNMSVKYLDPTSEDFASVIPGGDMSAVRTDNSSTTLYSYGVMRVNLSGNSGEKLQLGSGKTSEITMDIPASMVASAPATIPLWYFDETLGMWKEEGTATKQGDKYVGTVKHFTDWNCDVPGDNATVKGRVVDCKGRPFPGVVVRTGQSSTVSDANGYFERRVPTGVPFTVKAEASQNAGLESQTVNVPALSKDQKYDVGNLNMPCPALVKGNLKFNGTSKWGIVTLSWNGGSKTDFTDYDGNFKIIAPANKRATIWVYTFDNQTGSKEITTPSEGDSIDVGTIELTGSIAVGDNYFTLNGDGYSNKKFTLQVETNILINMYYNPNDNISSGWSYSNTGGDTVTLLISFKGQSLGSADSASLYLILQSKAYFTDYGDIALSVTKYGGIGDLIEGNYSGKLWRYNYNDLTKIYVNINGKFSLVRFAYTGKKVSLPKQIIKHIQRVDKTHRIDKFLKKFSYK
jgi:hypothetical protein